VLGIASLVVGLVAFALMVWLDRDGRFHRTLGGGVLWVASIGLIGLGLLELRRPGWDWPLRALLSLAVGAVFYPVWRSIADRRRST
jgi:hypothetical protein